MINIGSFWLKFQGMSKIAFIFSCKFLRKMKPERPESSGQNDLFNTGFETPESTT